MARKQLHFGLATTAGSRYAGLNQDVAFKAQRALGGGPSATTSPFASPRGRYGDQLLSSSQPNHSQPLIRHSRSASASPPPPQPRPARPPTCHIWGVLDGHGPLGELFSRTAYREIEDYLVTAWGENGTINEDMLAIAFSRAHRKLLEHAHSPPPTANYICDGQVVRFDLTDQRYGAMGYVYGQEWMPVESGTTATIVVYLEQSHSLIVANVGDSEGYIVTTPYGEPIISSSEWDSEGRSRTGSGREDDERSIDEHNVDDCLRPVTENHNPNNSEEMNRLMEVGLVNFDMSEGRGYLQLRSTPFKEGRHQYDYQLSLTRCLGHDLLVSAGVTWKPHIEVVGVDDDLEMVIIASDGLWDNLSRDEVLQVLRSHTEPQDAADVLIRRINARAVANPGVDNTTVVVTYFREAL